MNAKTLRDSLASILSSRLGTYTLANGSTTPAIGVRAAGEPRAPGTRVTGLEAIIVKEPDLSQEDTTSGLRVQYKSTPSFPTWTVFLIQWSGTGSAADAARVVMDTYPGSTFTTAGVPVGVGPLNQVRLSILTNPDYSLP
jgi:hypothetical protein